MSLLETDLGPGRHWQRVGDAYAVTKKPRGLDLDSVDSIPFAAMEAIPQGGAYDATFTPKAPSSITSGTYFERGDVLVGKITPSFENGKQAYAANLPQAFGYATTEVIPLHPKSNRHDPRLLFFYLLHPDIRHYVAERMEGSTGRQRVPDNVLLYLPMPAFENDDQTRMANALELIHRAITAESKSEANVRELKNAAMRELFTRGLRGEAQKDSEIGPIPESWRLPKLGTLGKIGNGTTPNRKNIAYWQGGTLPWITSGRMYERNISGSDVNVTPAALKDHSLPLLKPGAVLIAIVGQGKTLGHCALLEVDATVSRHVGFIQPNEKSIISRYLISFLESQYTYLRQLASGNGSTRGALTCSILRSLHVPLPSLDEQAEIAEILDAIDRKIDLHKRKRAVLEELFRTLLHKLMTGEIDVNDLDLSALPAANA
jgi:type I restriction enzyme S subunit